MNRNMTKSNQMRHKKTKLILFFLIGLGFFELQAQSLYVKEIAGTQTTYTLSNISKISFSPGSLTISLFDNSHEEYVLDSLRYLSFSDSTAVSIESKKNTKQIISIYPNPVSEELRIDISGTECPNGTLNILSIDGKLLKTQQISSLGITLVNMRQLPRGTYICQFSCEAEIKTVKIIKQ